MNAFRFMTSGLTSSKATQWQPKLSWYFVSTFKYATAGMRYQSTLVDADGVSLASFTAATETTSSTTRAGATGCIVVRSTTAAVLALHTILYCVRLTHSGGDLFHPCSRYGAVHMPPW